MSGTCFTGSRDDAFYDWDPKVFSVFPIVKHDGSGRDCYRSTDDPSQTICRGTINVTLGYASQFWITAGFACNYTSSIDLWYNVTLTGYADGEIPCVAWNNYFNEIPVIPKTLQSFVIGQCSQFYAGVSRWSLDGFSQFDILTMHLMLLSGLPCYKHSIEYICRIMLPECRRNVIYMPCAEMCRDFVGGCTLPYFAFGCTKFQNESSSTSKACVYTPTVCNSSQILLPPHSKAASQVAAHAHPTDVVDIECLPFYALSSANSSRLKVTCGFDGEWTLADGDVSSCQLSLWQVLLCTILLLLLVIVAVLALCYRYRFELRLLVFKYCSLFLCCFRMRKGRAKTERKYSAFISYMSYDYRFVDDVIFKPLCEKGYSIAVNYNCLNLLPGTHIREFVRVMENSATCIAVINQKYIDNDECMYELDEAIVCQLDDPDFKLILVTTEPTKRLINVPRWLRAYMRTNVYIESDDFEFLNKITRELPAPNAADGRTANDTEGACCVDVPRGEDTANQQPRVTGGHSRKDTGDVTVSSSLNDDENQALTMSAEDSTDTAALIF